MTHHITKLFSALTIAIVTLVASQANADIYDHIDRNALKIQQKSRLLFEETLHYRHTSEYRRLVIATNELTKLATHIHDVTHFEGNLLHLRSDLADMDRQFHDLEDLFDRIERRASYGHGHIDGNTAHVKDLLNCIEDSIHHIQEDVDQLVAPAACPSSVSRTVYVPTTVNRPVYVPARPVFVPTRPVYVPTRSSINVQFNKSRSGHSSHRHSDRGHGSRGHSYNRGNGRSNHGSRSGFSIGGGSSKIHIRF